MSDIKELGVGSRVSHERYGEGIVSETALDGLKVIFKSGGEKEFSLEYDGLEVISQQDRPADALTMDDVEKALATVLQKFADFTPIIPLGERWKGGKMILKPGSPDLQSKEIPIETFFHKIVMVRDRLRVLEQNVNKSNLTDEEKVNIQQYITRMYGSMTSFNILFKEREHQFRGESSRG